MSKLSDAVSDKVEADTKERELVIVTAALLVATHPDYRAAVIDGLLREGETMNVIAAPKIGKSWLVLLLAFCVAHGLPFLGRRCARGPVLIIDNELHPETAAQRLRHVADALSVDLEGVHLVSLRGELEDLNALQERLKRAAEKVGAKMIVLDALYRLIPEGTSENDNAGMMQLYNTIDAIAKRTGAAIVCIHHSSKGGQGEKSVTDGGAGAGAVSRAADCHVFLREHEDAGQVVVDAVARSWPPPQSVVIARPGLLWEVVGGADPTRVKGRKVKTGESINIEELMTRFMPPHPEPVETILARIAGCGGHIAKVKLVGLLGLAVASGRAVVEMGQRGSKLYGREASPAGAVGTQTERAAAYARANPQATHSEIAAVVGCTLRTVGRALGAA